MISMSRLDTQAIGYLNYSEGVVLNTICIFVVSRFLNEDPVLAFISVFQLPILRIKTFQSNVNVIESKCHANCVLVQRRVVIFRINE